MNLNKGIAAVAIAAIILSMSGFSSEAKSIGDLEDKKEKGMEIVKIPSKHHHYHYKYINSCKCI